MTSPTPVSTRPASTLLGLGLGVVRVPLDRDRYLVGAGGRSATEHLAELDAVVDRVAGHGAYTILSLETLGDATLGRSRTDPAAGGPTRSLRGRTTQSVALWRTLADRYADEPAVLFDLFAAPHARLSDDPTEDRNRLGALGRRVRFVVAEIRRVHPRAVCIVAGLAWATDLPGLPDPRHRATSRSRISSTALP